MRRGLLFVALALGISIPSYAQDLSGRWRLEIQNAKREVVTTFTLRFTRDQAESCLALFKPKAREELKWRKLKIEAMSTTDSTFYPVTDPLAYGIEEGTLTIGNVEFCDGYALLEGGLAVQPVLGRYFTLGITGSVDRGYFKLARVE